MLRDIAKTVPLDRLLVETDCPYLTPVPHRGKRNEPAYVSFVAHTLAQLHADAPDMSIDVIERITTRNAKRLFKIA
jgi:TatD DNase family protein